MALWSRALGYGVLVWLIPFAVAFALFPLKESWRSLFESVMPVTGSLAVVWLAVSYFRKRKIEAGKIQVENCNAGAALIREGIQLGVLWMVISILIDLPLMLTPPLNYTLQEYVADIGLTYVMIPIITTGIAAATSSNERPPAGAS